ncbi:unnamed protein product [Anisakis simplex]|uniref:Annexin n=1 Tax=Anisakis simplex TaxID=6269 RepID=A0A3P6NR73_ANISI|nr:unnamed protein product [Anisakis simplex]
MLQKDLATYRCDEPRLTHLMLSMNNQQRRMLFVPYKNKFGKDLISEIQRLCRRNFKNVMVALLESPTTLDVKQLRYSMKGLGTTERILIEILATRNNTELAAIRTEYQKAYGHSLASDVIGDTSGSFRQLLVSLLQGRRSESSWVDFSSAYQEAYKLSEACKRRARNLDADFNRVLVTQSYVQLRKIFEYFKEMAGYTIEQAITKFFRRDTRRGFLAVVASAVNKPKFFAQQLYASMKGLGTRNNDLIRLIVSRAEIDMAAISDEFEVAYGKTLVDYIRGDTSGGYRDALIAIVKGNSKYRY